MWFYFPQKWYEVPGFLWRAWHSARAEDRLARARATEGPSRPVATPARTPRRPADPEVIMQLREQVARMRPEKCCKGAVMVAAGKRHDVCSDDCEWSKLELLVATASVDVN